MNEFKPMPALSDFTRAAFGDEWYLQGSWRKPLHPNARVVTKKELAAVTKQWRAAWAAAECPLPRSRKSLNKE